MGRDSSIVEIAITYSVSIHAPAWGATWYNPHSAGQEMFQSTRPHGARHYSKARPQMESCFNPRARMGRDPWLTLFDYFLNCFNPRARMGRD
mgnify:CR=1 FL=1